VDEMSADVNLQTDEEAARQRELATSPDVPLSSREKQLLRRFAQGKTDRQIAVNIGGTERRISAQRERLLQKLHIQTAAQLVSAATSLARWPGHPKPSE